MDRDVLCIMVKEPRAGLVKTRLAPAVGPDGAAALARAFLDDTVALACGLAWARVVATVEGNPASLDLPGGIEVWPQGPGDLGERMERALLRALAPGRKVILVGTDSPGLPPRMLEAARSALTAHDAVLGPAADGGYYLIGLRRCEPGLLSGLPWSRPDTLVHTEARLRNTGHTVARIDPWFDVDEPGDLVRLGQLIGRGQVQAPATRRALERLGILEGPPA